MDLIPNKNNGYNGGGAPEELNFRRNVLGVGGQQEGKILSSKGFLRFSIIAFRVSLGVLFLAVAGAAFFYVMSYQTKGKVVSGQNDLENRRQELQGESFVKHRDNVRQIEAMKKMMENEADEFPVLVKRTVDETRWPRGWFVSPKVTVPTLTCAEAMLANRIIRTAKSATIARVCFMSINPQSLDVLFVE